MIAAVDLIASGAEKLRSANISDCDAKRESEILFAKSAGCESWELYLNEKTEQFSKGFENLIKKRQNRFPLQYLLGQVPFRNVTLKVDERCLIPRPETELLVEQVSAVLTGAREEKTILDIGTGSGAIAISLAKEHSDVSVVAVDRSSEALEIARENAILNDVQNRIKLVNGDCFEGLEGLRFDIIVSNPPYLSEVDFTNLQPELRYEPKAALDGGKDGLTFFRKIVYNAGNFLMPGGMLFLEVGAGQAGMVEKFFQESRFGQVKIYKDYQGIDRIISGVING